MKTDKWVKRWKVDGSNGNVWTVAIDKDGNYGCSCPQWKFYRKSCKHIQSIKANPNLASDTKHIISRPELIPANILRPTFDRMKNTIFYPLVPLGAAGVWMEVTICWFLLEHGFSWCEVREHRHLPASWTRAAVYAYIEHHGPAEYSSYMDGPQIPQRQAITERVEK